MRRSTGTIMSWKVNIAEVGKPGRITTGLPSHTARHSGLPGFSATPCAMMPGLAEPGDDAVGDVAGAFRGAARQHQHVAGCERIAHRGFELRLVVGNGAEKHRLAAILGDRRGDDRAIGVVDRGRAQRQTRLHQFVAGRDDGDARPARDGDFAQCRRPPACRSRASRSWCRRAAAPRRARCRNRHRRRIARATRRGGSRSRGIRPAACVRPSRWRRRRAAPDRRSQSRSRFPTTPAASARCRRRSPRRSAIMRTGAASPADGKIGGAHRKAIDIGAVERRHVDRRHHVLRQRAAERIRKRPLLARHGARETTRPRNAPARPRATEWSGTGPDRWHRGLSAGASRSCGHPYHSRSI